MRKTNRHPSDLGAVANSILVAIGIKPKRELVRGILDTSLSLELAGDFPRLRHELALRLAAAVAAGGRWLGRSCRRGRVLYVSTQETPLEIRDELFAIARAVHRDPEIVYERVRVVGSLHRSGQELLELVHRCIPLDDKPPALVVIDEAKHPTSRYARRAHLGNLASLARSLGAAVVVVRSGHPDENADAFDAHCRISSCHDGCIAVTVAGPVGGGLPPLVVRRPGEEVRA